MTIGTMPSPCGSWRWARWALTRSSTRLLKVIAVSGAGATCARAVAAGRAGRSACSHQFVEIERARGGLRLLQRPVDDVLLDDDRLDFGEPIAVGEIMTDDLARVLVGLRELLDLLADLLGLGLQSVLAHDLRDDQAESHAPLGLLGKRVRRHRRQLLRIDAARPQVVDRPL